MDGRAGLVFCMLRVAHEIHITAKLEEAKAAANESIKPLGRLPKIAVCCITYGRPFLVSTVVGCFARQAYPSDLCEMVILDDGKQLRPGAYQFGGREVRVYHSERFATLGGKRNAARKLVSSDVDAVTFWDDDDVYLPWALEAMADRLQHVGIALMSWTHWQEKNGKIHLIRKVMHAGGAFLTETFDAIGGYPLKSRGEDMALLKHWVSKGGHGHFPPERNTMDNYHPYTIIRRFLPETYHATHKSFDYDALVVEPHGNIDIYEAPLPPDVEAYCYELAKTNCIGRKPKPDSSRT